MYFLFCFAKIKCGSYFLFYINILDFYFNRYPGLLGQTISYKPDLDISWNRFGYNFQVSGRTGLLFSSELAMLNFASSVEVEKTIEMPVEGKDELISPIFELSQNVSRKGFNSGFYHDLFPFSRTLIISERNWKLPHLIAQGTSYIEHCKLFIIDSFNTHLPKLVLNSSKSLC